MFRYVMLFSLCATALGAAVHSDAASTAVTQRKARSIWPFSSSDASEESPISGEHALLLEQAGLDKSFNLSSHPLWKIHKYHGIDLKPVQIETEIIKSTTANGGENQSTSGAFNAESSGDKTSATTSELPDLSFLNDLGGLADFLPDPEEDEASELIANAIEKEESSHPGFFRRLWWRIWGTSESSSATKEPPTEEAAAPSTLEFLTSLFGFAPSQQDAKEKDEEEKEGNGEDSLTIYLPETQGSYMAVVLPSDKRKNPLVPQQNILLPSQAAPPLFRETVANVAQALEPPSNHAQQYRDETGVTAVAAGTEGANLPLAKLVARRPVAGATGSESQAWIQSWTPHAAYTVHVQGPSSQRQQQHQQSQAAGNYEAPQLPEVSQSWTPRETESNVQLEQPNSEPSSNLEPPAPVGTDYHSPDLSISWPQVLTQDVPPVLEAFQNTGGEQQASRKSSEDSVVEDEEDKNEQRDQQQNQKQSPEKNQEKNQDASGDKDKVKDILSHFRIPEGLIKKLQVSEKDVDTILNDKESAARAAERLRSLQKEFEMRKEQLSYVYATKGKKQLN